MASNLVNIFSTDKVYYAELIRQMLADHHIHCFIINKQDSVYKFGDIEIFVHRDHVIRAKMLIRDFEAH